MLQSYPILVLTPVIGLLVNVVTHVALSRIRKGRGQMVCMFAGTSSGLVADVAISSKLLFSAGFTGDVIACMAINFITYMALAWCYFHFVNLNLASLRIRLLNEISLTEDGVLEDEISKRYNAESVIATRLERLAGWGHLVERDGRYFVGKSTFVLIYDIFEVLKYALLGRGNKILAGIIANEFPPINYPILSGIGGIAKGLTSFILKYDFCRFLITGGINTLFSYLLYAALILIGFEYKVTITILSVITIVWNYHTTGRFVFGYRGFGLIFKFVAVYGLIYLINLLSLMFLVKHGYGPLISQAILTPLIAVTSFVLNKLWVFRAK